MRYFLFDRERIKTQQNGLLFLIGCCLILLFSFTLMYIPTEADGDIYDNVIRFHVIANSDSEDDQDLKLILRDAIIDESRCYLESYENKEEAYVQLSSMTDEINDFSQKFIRSRGYNYSCETVIDKEYYERTEYNNYVMPKGTYTSLKVVIGNGEGKNWWCVLFPPLCTQMALRTTAPDDMEGAFIEAGFTGEQYKIITENKTPKYRVKFRLVELFFGEN